jgi:hypothetical protein
MAALVCDLCGGKLIMGAGGIATCESCGTGHSADRMKEKVQEIKGTVRVDNSHMIENYLEMARTAKDAGNNAEAESYCNKVIEIEPTNYKAWMLKGEAVAWQSSLQSSRVDEGVTAFVKGINNAPEEEKEGLIEDAKEQIKNLSLAMISLRADRFAKWPDEEETSGFMSDLKSIISTVLTFLTQTGALIPYAEIMAPIATQITQSVEKAYHNVIWPDYRVDINDSDDRAGKYEWQTFIKRVGYCTSLLEQAIDLCDEDDEDNIQRYERLIYMHKDAIDSCSWNYEFTNLGKFWYKEWYLSDEAKRARRALISQYEAKVRDIEASIAAKRFDAYWAEHVEEKASLETEQKDLNSKIAAFTKEIEAIPGKAEIDNVDERIKKLTGEISALGLFKGKEKKALQEQIDQANTEKKGIQDRMDAAKKKIEAEICPLRDRVNIISYELTKAR